MEMPEGGWWHEHLVEKGLGRIHTKGAEVPDGGSWKNQRRKLRDLEGKAKGQKIGGWGM